MLELNQFWFQDFSFKENDDPLCFLLEWLGVKQDLKNHFGTDTEDLINGSSF